MNEEQKNHIRQVRATKRRLNEYEKQMQRAFELAERRIEMEAELRRRKAIKNQLDSERRRFLQGR